ncbi:type III secretion system inner membrane ring subunit SctD [Thiothrix lacustris]|uniref:Type III secretion system inner membrane ring subunit SctD n=1 Tax=Thiothrix lacustris TaxID=525917 RepID=A0ABY9MUG9_9GAMM|nr:type III secretion system inner membrane ring subunit SctD [Thiothrix lacustris]WML91806.1 type III secretion system inner membrane ring subunit SctD [Thiothrix lacustris]WMP16359.1 type III secretion system inner membrane ring subunit SctD [Thiothrix lacustris]
MAIQQTSFVLKVLSGINTGASVRLKTGSLVIGRAMTSDIILHDENIADQHVQLLITSAGITLQPLARPVFVGGAEVTDASIDLLPYQSVKLGNVDFLVTDSRVAPPQAKHKSADVAVNLKGVDASGVMATARVEQPKKSARAARPSSVQKTGGRVWLLLLGLSLLLLANALYWTPQFKHLLESLGMRESGEQQAANLMQDLGKQDFKLVKEADGSVSLSGYTNTVLERNELMSKIQSAGIKANLHIWAQDEMANNANMIARAMGQSALHFKSGSTDGVLVAQGFVSKTADWERVKATILNDVGGIRSISEGEFQTMDGYLASFVQFIEKKGLSSRINATTDGKSVIVNGELTQPEIKKLKGFLNEFNKLQDEGPAVVLKVSDVRDRIKLSIRSVSVGQVPFMVSKDGKKYMEGSTLGDKYFVKSIQSDHVILTNNGIDIPFYYGIEKGRNNDAANRAEPQK